jgi:hypothetical protein
LDDYIAFRDDETDVRALGKVDIPVVFPPKKAASSTGEQSHEIEHHYGSTIDPTIDQQPGPSTNSHSGESVPTMDGQGYMDIDPQDSPGNDQHQDPATETLEQRYLRTLQDLQRAEEGRLNAERETKEAKERLWLRTQQYEEMVCRQTVADSSSSATSATLPEWMHMLKLETRPTGVGTEAIAKREEDTKGDMSLSIKTEPEHYILFDDNDDEADDKKGFHLKTELDNLEYNRRNTGLFAHIKDEDIKDVKDANIVKREFMKEDSKDAVIPAPKVEENRMTPNALKKEEDVGLKRSPSTGTSDTVEFPGKRLRFE